MLSVKEKVCSYKALNDGLNHCNKNVTWKDSVLGFNKNRCANLYNLQAELLNGTYKISRYVTFQVREPKVRDIVATRLKDRVFQRSLCDNYLTEEVTRHFIYDNCACQKHKGTDFARRRLKVHLLRYYRKHGERGYVLKLDIKNFFGSTLHSIAKEKIGKLIRDDWARERVFDIIDSFDGDMGIGLGSQVSQLIELAVLNDIDHLIKERYHIKHYIRYMDDMLIIHQSKEYLINLLRVLTEELNKIGLQVSKNKTCISKLGQPTKFLGFRYYLLPTGKVLMTTLRTVVSRAKRRLRKHLNNPRMTLKKIYECLMCFIAHIKKGNNHHLILHLYTYFIRRITYGRLKLQT